MMPGLSASATLACLVIVISSAAALEAQSPAQDPWSRVPPLSTGCYSEEDFLTKVSKAKEQVDADAERQRTINAALKEQYNQIDPMEMAQRMQAYMMKNPQEAERTMRAMQATGTAVNDQVTTMAANASRLQQELDAHMANFKTAVKQAQDPVWARITTLVKTKSEVCGEGECISFPNPADKAQYQSLLKQVDTEYEKICPAWWGPRGHFQQWLGAYKTHLINDVIQPDEANEGVVVAQMAIMETPTVGYRSTARLEGVSKYLDHVYRIYAVRGGRTREEQVFMRANK